MIKTLQASLQSEPLQKASQRAIKWYSRLRSWLPFLVAVFTLASAPATLAQIEFGPNLNQPPKVEPLIRDLNPLNLKFIEKQRQVADDLVRFELGRRLYQRQEDLRVIQRAIDKGHLDNESKETLQAFGAAMGDVFVAYHKNLNWKVYEDELGASHAVCLDGTQHCIFPMTILSRRMEAGLKPDVAKIFDDILITFKPYFPKLPYSREQ
jgi:hypothetical protein